MQLFKSLGSSVQRYLGTTVAEHAEALVRQRRWIEALPVLEAERTRLGPDHAEMLALLGRCYYHLGRFQEAVACLERRADGLGVPLSDGAADELACARLWNGEIGAALRRVRQSGALGQSLELLAARIALDELVDESELLLPEESVHRLCALCVRLAQVGQVGRALRLGQVAHKLQPASEAPLHALAFALLTRGRDAECEQAVALIEAASSRSARLDHLYAVALHGVSRHGEALQVLQLLLAAGEDASGRYTLLEGRVLRSLGQHRASGERFERCVGRLSGAAARSEALIQAASEYVLDGALDDALRVYALFERDVPSSLRTPDFEAQYAINTRLRQQSLHFDALLPAIVPALLCSSTAGHRARAIDICSLWHKIVEHLKADLDPDLVVCVCHALLHSTAAHVALARDMLDCDLRRCLRGRVESFAQYMRRRHSEKINAPPSHPAGCFDALTAHELLLFNLQSWALHIQGDEVGCEARRNVVRRGCELLHLHAPDYGVHDLDRSHALLLQQSLL